MNGPEAFSAAWAEAWCRALNESEAWREAGAGWEGAVVLVMTGAGGAPRRAVHLDLHRGRCRGARVASDGDVAAAAYVMEADAATWRGLLDGGTAPLMALMTSRLRLTRGSMTALLPLAGAARELVAAAVAMRSSFPEDAA